MPSAPTPDPSASPAPAYRVLARRYRPVRFADLIGQEPMVNTLHNAFAMNRIAHAFLLTGVRGVGKTTTARLLARALNYATAAQDAPCMDWPEEGIHCAAIMAGRHMDVQELDAASHTGIADIREILSRLQYAPTTARYKIYIIDEVHMLSTAAFNGLLKTLEEPPAHVKFIFATTEARKIPITILSRCQRFDLRRLDEAAMTRLLQSVAEKEQIALPEDACRILARAADGSARDALSLLDQAIAMTSGAITADALSDMLSLADASRIRALFEALMHGNAPKALDIANQLHDLGADPATIITDLADLAHEQTLQRIHGKSQLSLRDLSRTWTLLMNARAATANLAALEMLFIKIAYTANLPHLDEALNRLSLLPAAQRLFPPEETAP